MSSKKAIFLVCFLFYPFLLSAKSLLPEKPSRMIPLGMANLSGKGLAPGGNLVGSPYSSGTFHEDHYVGETSEQWVIAYKLTKSQSVSRLLWEYQGPKGGLSTSPLIHNGQVVLAFKDGTIATLELATGKEKWSSKLESSFIDAPLVLHDGHLYVSTFSQILYKVDFSQGAIVWAYQMGMSEDVRIRTETAPVFTKDSVFIGNTDGDILNLNLKTGKLNFVFRSPFVSLAQFKNLVGPIFLHKGALYAARYDGYVMSLDLSSKGSKKNLRWHFETKGAITASKADLEQGVYYIGTSEGEIHALDLQSGKTLWKKPLFVGLQSMTQLILSKKYLYAAASRGTLFCFSRETGELLETLDLKTQVLTEPFQVGQTLLFPSNEKSLFYRLYIF